jgi:hypothetical protein
MMTVHDARHGRGVSTMTGDVTITEAIKQLRAQLAEAQREGGGKDLRFRAKSVEVELAMVFKTSVEGGASVKAWFLDISGKANKADETTHRFKLVLEPVGPDGKPVRVSDAEHENE